MNECWCGHDEAEHAPSADGYYCRRKGCRCAAFYAKAAWPENNYEHEDAKEQERKP